MSNTELMRRLIETIEQLTVPNNGYENMHVCVREHDSTDETGVEVWSGILGDYVRLAAENPGLYDVFGSDDFDAVILEIGQEIMTNSEYIIPGFVGIYYSIRRM